MMGCKSEAPVFNSIESIVIQQYHDALPHPSVTARYGVLKQDRVEPLTFTFPWANILFCKMYPIANLLHVCDFLLSNRGHVLSALISMTVGHPIKVKRDLKEMTR